MTRIIAIILGLALLLGLSGCVTVSFTSYGVEGKGDIVTREYDIWDFNNLELGVSGSLYLVEGDTASIKIEAYENHLDYIDVESPGGRSARIESSERLVSPGVNGGGYPKIYVAAPALKELTVNGGVHIAESRKFTGEAFSFIANGAVSGGLELDVQELEVHISGASDLALNGTAETVYINSSGASSIEAYGLDTTDTVIELDGAGDAEISCSGTLEADIDGVGSITYKGDCTVTERIGGMGSVEKAA